MKIVFFMSLLISFLVAQEYKQGKIDMHGGTYSPLTGYKTSNFGNSNMNSLLLRDKNATKKAQGEKDKEKYR
jgi:hypothetical protein